jgi:hypothetical protein
MNWDEFWEEVEWFKHGRPNNPWTTVTFTPQGAEHPFDLTAMTKEWVRLP